MMIDSMDSPPKRHRNLYPGINARITGPFLAIILVMAAIGMYVVMQLVAGSVQERFNNQLLDSASAASNAIVDIERQQLATLRLMVFTEGVPQAIADHNINKLLDWFRPIAASSSSEDVIVFDLIGRGMTRLKRNLELPGGPLESPPPPPLESWQGVQRVIGDQVDRLGDKFVDVISMPPDQMLYISAPVIDKDGVTLGGVSIGVTGGSLAERVSRQALSAVTLYNHTGKVLGSTYRGSIATGVELAPERAAGLLRAVQNGANPIEEVILEGTTYQVLYAPFQMRSQRIGLLAVALRSNFIVDRSGTSRDVFIALFSAVFVSVGAVGLVAARSITRPVARLVDATRAIRSGDLSRRVGLQMPDELGELSVSFDHMTDQLVQRNEEINQLYLHQVQETARRDAVLAGISDGVLVLDPTNTTILQNRTAEALVNASRSDAQSRREFIQLSRRASELTEPKIIPLAGRVFSAMATPVCMPSGELLGQVLVFRDITAIMEAERLKDELIQQMSHELRTPLTAVRGYMELLGVTDKPNLSQEGVTFVQNAVEGLATLERLVNQVIDVSAVVSNQFKLDIQSFDLVELLQERVSAWLPYMQRRSLELKLYTLSQSIPLEADSKRLGQVLDHLLRNAYSYTLPGGSVEVRAGLTRSRVHVSVIDTGVGIGPDEVNRVFDRLYRGRSADAGPTDARGLGLGLYLSKRIVEAHGGIISLASQVEQGTKVTIQLPISARAD